MKYKEVLVATETDNELQCINRLLKVLTQKGRYWLCNRSSIPCTLKTWSVMWIL